MKLNMSERDTRLAEMLSMVIRETRRQLDVIKRGLREGSSDRRAVGDVTDDVIREVDITAVSLQSSVLTARLAAATESLRRLESRDGTYGFCDDCGGTISETRLQALPFAKRCIACQDESEHRAPLSRRQTGARYSA